MGDAEGVMIEAKTGMRLGGFRRAGWVLGYYLRISFEAEIQLKRKLLILRRKWGMKSPCVHFGKWMVVNPLRNRISHSPENRALINEGTDAPKT